MQLLSFLLGLALGALGLHTYYSMHPEKAPGAREELTAHSQEAAEAKLESWDLSPDAVRRDLEEQGKLVRRKAEAAGHSISKAITHTRILSVIKAKYTLDKDLSARDIEVDVDGGRVVLRGTVPSMALVSKAVALAMDTEGVTEVEAQLDVRRQ